MFRVLMVGTGPQSEQVMKALARHPAVEWLGVVDPGAGSDVQVRAADDACAHALFVYPALSGALSAAVEQQVNVVLDWSNEVSDTLLTAHHLRATVVSGPALDLLVQWVGAYNELAARLDAQEQDLQLLREVQTLLEAVIQSTQDAITVVDKDGRQILINPAYTRLTGLSPEQVIGKSADVDIAEGDSMHMQVLTTGRPVRNAQMKVGPYRREVIVNVAPILVNGELRGSVGVIHDISEIKQLTEALDRANKLLRSLHAKYTFSDVVGKSPAMVVAVDQAKRAAKTPATVLLRGESGTGKELFAHAIHNESDRRLRPFVRVSCAAISESLLESEMFGYEEGAFTGARRGGRRGLFEEASGGTLFLDEIGEMSIPTQAKLLRALQEKEIVRVGGTTPIPINVRIIAATHVNLEQAVAKGRFREDLYYRLNVIPIVIPPLRYRKEDIEAIATQIVLRLNQAYGRNVTHLTPAAVATLMAYDWPGNVRELENVIGRAMTNVDYRETELDARHLPILTPHAHGEDPDSLAAALPLGGSLQEVLHTAERIAIERALAAAGGNKTEAARRLGISVRSLYYKLNQTAE
ncbi:sigma-54 interaction domain-containing protein [Alicyclobacillus cycloheptanicus]|uniref:PAS domain S-box-containing protein n=1 Tax=Alicyclobacillus cycloheptanicus TaxID=1457 RepID=A0ABT9XDN9_9BACL|nr:sigma-54-dependent Fis family transcriptional regulator [Alicyclobacillus cycloheptanicus]MDQ0188411.1 PAS domain S-box-containing protein [Alicyclobacillus cycloheptanicus]